MNRPYFPLHLGGLILLAAGHSWAQGPTLSGVVSAGAFGEFTSVSNGSWIEIYGSNLANQTRSWGSADFNGTNAPTSLNGTSVMIGDQQAFVSYISPAQVNALLPFNVSPGSQPD